MENNLVIDTSVFLNYAYYNKMYMLANAIINYRLNVFINNQLLAELYRNIPKALKKSEIDPFEIIELIKSFTFHIQTVPVFKSSPDPKDNFLFDLAIQSNSDLIVTKETALLQFKGSPVAMRDIKWFKEKYEVPL